MCGFAGLALDHHDELKLNNRILQQMGNAIYKRGPDAQGVWLSNDLALGFVHQRLAIQDLSEHGAQPMQSPKGRYVIAFNGEIYNFLILREQLQQMGYHFRGGSDTEVILAGFEAWGIEPTILKMVGMFAIAVVDIHEKKLHLIRDRMGEKPLYYYQSNSQLFFGSELKALMAIPEFPKIINRNSIALLLKHNYIPAPWSIFENTYKLEPAHILTFELNRLSCPPTIKCYWQPQLNWEKSFDNESVTETLEELLTQSISEQMISDVPLGAFLSGGIDSSTIVALMQKHSHTPVKTFSIGFNVEGYNEAIHAKAVANHLGTDHTEFYLSPTDALNVIAELPKIYDEPFADSSQIPTYLVSKLTRQKVTVALSGDAGDELFAGYSRYRTYQNRFHKLAQNPLKAAVEYMPAEMTAAFTWTFKKSQRQLPWWILKDKVLRHQHAAKASTAIDFYRDQVGYWIDPTLLAPTSKIPQYAFDQITDRQDFISSLQWADIKTYLPDDILAKVDRAAMANSLETRVPFLDHRIVEFALKIPTNLLNNAGVSKIPIRNILYKYVPKSLIERPKQGFAIPKAEWLRNQLKDWASHLLSVEMLSKHDYFDNEKVQELWQTHIHTQHDFSFQLWPILMFQLWYLEYLC